MLDHMQNDVIRDKTKVCSIREKLQKGKLRWYEHVKAVLEMSSWVENKRMAKKMADRLCMGVWSGHGESIGSANLEKTDPATRDHLARKRGRGGKGVRIDLLSSIQDTRLEG